ncbi:MAG: aspartyl protease family protein [Candidatus Sulfotelmatobacter sp.]
MKTSFLIFVLFAACAAQTQLLGSRTPDCPRDASGTKLGPGDAIELPIQLYRGYLVLVEGSIGNLEKLTFIVDTGAYPSVIDQKIATALGLKERDGAVAMVNRTVETKLATLPLVAVGPVRVEDVRVRVQDLSSIGKTLARRIDAVVGLDVLGTSSFSIDYRTKRLRFGRARRTRSSVSFETGNPFVIVEAQLDDNPVRLIVDTGTPALVLFQSHLKRPFSRFAGTTATATDGGGEDYRLQPVPIPDARLGRHALGPLTGFVVADQRDDARDFDGLLSVRSLRLEEIGFDFENHEISWRK